MGLFYFRSTRCTHECDCGALMICSTDHDRCIVGKHWTCDNCHDQQRADYFNSIANAPEPTQETT